MFSWFKKKYTIEYISGRIATKDDVKFGFFSATTDLGEEISRPYYAVIPQPVVHINNDTKKRNKGTLIQAEKIIKTEMKGKVMCTVRFEDGSTIICLLEELALSKQS